MSIKTALFQKHINSKALMVDFYGWKMPMNYGSQIEEHHHVRQTAGMFDVSHMMVTDFILDAQGEDNQIALDQFLRQLLTCDVLKLEQSQQAYQAKYCLLLNHEGGIIDDLIVYKTSYGYRIVSNCSTRAKVTRWFKHEKEISGLAGFSIQHPEDLSLIAVQGPEATSLSLKAIEAIGISFDSNAAETLAPFSSYFLTPSFMISTTGYTGEAGFELILSNELAPKLWEALLKLGVKPAGLGARDTLRLESGMMLYGQDMDENFSPGDARLNWTLDLTDSTRIFNGLESIQNHTPKFAFKSFVLEGKAIPRHNQIIFEQGSDQPCGQVTSGSYSPTLLMGIGYARLNHDAQGPFDMEIRKKRQPIHLTKGPFVKKGIRAFQHITD